MISNLIHDITSWRMEMFVDSGVWETLQPLINFDIFPSDDLLVVPANRFHKPMLGTEEGIGLFHFNYHSQWLKHYSI